MWLSHVGTSYARSDFLFHKKSVTRSTVPPLSQKVTLGSPVRLQAPSQRLAVATNFLRVRELNCHRRNAENIFFMWVSHVGAKFALLRFIFCIQQKISHPPAPYSSFFTEGRAQCACSVASTRTTARCRCQLLRVCMIAPYGITGLNGFFYTGLNQRTV